MTDQVENQNQPAIVTNNRQVPVPRMPVLDATKGIHGRLIQYKNRQHLLRDGTVIPSDRKFLVIGRRKVAQRWEAGIPIEDIVEQPGGPPIDIAALNAAVPDDEKEVDPETGQLKDPWSWSYAIYLLDHLIEGQVYTHINGSGGQSAAYGTLGNRIEWMSAIRGEPVLPIVTLGEELHSKRYHNFRPLFVITGDWRRPDDISTPLGPIDRPLAPVGRRIAAPASTAAAAEPAMDDEIPF
jgi:hypothetical protein